MEHLKVESKILKYAVGRGYLTNGKFEGLSILNISIRHNLIAQHGFHGAFRVLRVEHNRLCFSYSSGGCLTSALVAEDYMRSSCLAC